MSISAGTATNPAPRRVVVMGVSGCGKSTVAQLVAQALEYEFVEGDELHPARNVALMAAGTPLTDADRQGWLQAVGARLAAPGSPAAGVVVSCSALKRSYRDLLRRAAPGLAFVHLHGSPDLLEQRMQQRTGHYMPAALLQSQIDTLQAPGVDELAVTLDIAAPPPALAVAALSWLRGLTDSTSPAP